MLLVFLIPLIMCMGTHFKFRVRDIFFRHWISLFANSYNAKLLWKERTGQSMRSYSNTRWWSKWEVQKHVYEYFGDVVLFLRENENLSPATRQHILEIIDNPCDLQDLRLELAVIIDAGAQFVEATYYLEGDGPLIFSCYERLSAVTNAIGVANFPSTSAIAREIANGDVVVQNQLITQAKACVQPGLLFFQEKFVTVQFHTIVRAFKVCMLLTHILCGIICLRETNI